MTVDDIVVTTQNVIHHGSGSIYHGIKSSDSSFCSFGELYFSRILYGHVKGWKFHKLMTLNLLVPYGQVKFVFIDSSANHKSFILGHNNYCRLTVPPTLWFAFQGLYQEYSIVSNVASIEHDPSEQLGLPLDSFTYDWTLPI